MSAVTIGDENAILAEMTWAAEAGALAYKDVRYLLVRPETVMHIQRAVEAEVGVERGGELFYGGGFTGGQLSGRRYKEVFGLTEQQAVEFMCRMGGQIGWGRFEITRFDAALRRLEVRVENSAFAAAYRLPGEPPPAVEDLHPVCHLIRGVLAGLMSGLFGCQVRARETACRAQGQAACQFLIEGSR
jgi:predicted hydrocarbon binding protein